MLTCLHKVKECSGGEKQLVIIPLLNGQSIDLQFNEQYCEFYPPKQIIYKMHYIPVMNGDLTNVQKFIKNNEHILTQRCNRLVIYIDDEYADGEKKELLKQTLTHNLHKVLISLRLYHIHKTILNAFSDLEFENSAMKENFNIDMTYQLNFDSFSRMKWIQDDIHFLPISIGEPFTRTLKNNLTCQPWFKTYLSNLYSCGKGRLIQKSGTCYLNSVLNGFILSDKLKAIVIRSMEEFVAENPLSIKYITSKLENVLVCPNIFGGVGYQRLMYLFRMIYNMVCKNERPFDRALEQEDVLIEASRELFSQKIPLGQNPTRFTRSSWQKTLLGERLVKGVGGDPNLVFQTLAFDLGLSIVQCRFLPLAEKKFSFSKIQSPTRVEELETDYVSKDVDIIIFQTNNSIYENDIKLNLEKMFYPEFTCEICLLSFYYMNPKTQQSFGGPGHGVLGFKCEEVPKIYDSSTNIIFEANWLELSSQSFDSMRTLFATYTKHATTFEDLWMYIVFVRNR
uniref:Uncharacterized protein n=1 Tax=viral metagenome TaxID=1070528 RepID=A0A6C0KUV9_9ZZZZ